MRLHLRLRGRTWPLHAGCRGHQHVRRQIDAAVGDGRNHRDKLHGRDADFLADGDGADRSRSPLVRRAQQAARFAGQFDAGAAAEAEIANVFVEVVRAHLERELDGSHVAGMLQALVHGNDVGSDPPCRRE